MQRGRIGQLRLILVVISGPWAPQSLVARLELFYCVTTPDHLPSSVNVCVHRVFVRKPLNHSRSIAGKQWAQICTLVPVYDCSPSAPSAYVRRELPSSRRALIPARMWFHAECSESAREDMVPCPKGLGSSLFDSARARPCHYVDCIRTRHTFLGIFSTPTRLVGTPPRRTDLQQPVHRF